MKYSVVAKKDAKSHAVEEKIKERLQSSGWIYDKAEPEVIQREFGLSKAAFKRAVGHLMKEKQVVIRDGKIWTAEKAK